MTRYYLYTEEGVFFTDKLPRIVAGDDYFLLVLTTKDEVPVSYECEAFICGNAWKGRGKIKDVAEGVCHIGYAHFLAWRKLITSKCLRVYPFPILTYPEEEYTREFMDLQYLVVANPYLWVTPLHRLARRVKEFLLESRLCYPSVEMTQEQSLVYQRQTVDILAGVDQHINYRQMEHEKSVEKYEAHLESLQKKMLHQLNSVLDETKREMYEELLLLREEVFRDA